MIHNLQGLIVPSSDWCLVVFSFGLQNAVDTNSPEVAYCEPSAELDLDPSSELSSLLFFFRFPDFFKCAALATTMLKNAHERLALHPYFRQAPDSRFVFLTYAAVSFRTSTHHYYPTLPVMLPRPPLAVPPLMTFPPRSRSSNSPSQHSSVTSPPSRPASSVSRTSCRRRPSRATRRTFPPSAPSSCEDSCE